MAFVNYAPCNTLSSHPTIFIRQAPLIITTSKNMNDANRRLLCAYELSGDIMFKHVSVRGLIISRGHACYSATLSRPLTLLVNSAPFFFFCFFFFQVTSHLTNCDIFMSLCSFISQLPINPKLSATQPTVNKQHWKEVAVVVVGAEMLLCLLSIYQRTVLPLGLIL